MRKSLLSAHSTTILENRRDKQTNTQTHEMAGFTLLTWDVLLNHRHTWPMVADGEHEVALDKQGRFTTHDRLP